MRELKFRAWDKIDEVMMSHERVMSQRYAKSEDNVFNDKSQIIMQYTGLKDKNRNEIYEGDIVKDHLGVGIVEYVEKYGAFRVNYQNGKAKWFYDYSLRGERESIEVIGNIHENAELLT